MTSRMCKYGCGVLLEGWDDNAKKYIEAGTGGLHTRERCEEAKAKLAQGVDFKKLAARGSGSEDKNDHGNESFPPKVEGKILEQGKETTELKSFVDHTQGQPTKKWKIKTLTDPTPEGFDLKYNAFVDTHDVKAGQSHVVGSLYAMVVWYSEEGKA